MALLLANVAFNEGQALLRRGQENTARVHWERSSRWLKSAFARRAQARFSYLRLEIEADYALLIKKDFAGAASIYERLAETRMENPLHTTLRAHWMLAGIHSGDWGVAHAPAAATLIDGAQVRHHLTQIQRQDYGLGSDPAYRRLMCPEIAIRVDTVGQLLDITGGVAKGVTRSGLHSVARSERNIFARTFCGNRSVCRW